MFVQDNRGKRAVCIDLQQPSGKELFLKLVATADVLVTNLRVSALEKLGTWCLSVVVPFCLHILVQDLTSPHSPLRFLAWYTPCSQATVLVVPMQIAQVTISVLSGRAAGPWTLPAPMMWMRHQHAILAGMATTLPLLACYLLVILLFALLFAHLIIFRLLQF